MVHIKKAKIKEEKLICEYTESREGGVDKISKECGETVHQDMVDAFRKLDVHVAIICEQVVEQDDFVSEDDRFSDADKKISTAIWCTGYSIGGEDEHEGVTLIGRRDLTSGKALNLVAPFTKWDDEHNQYTYGYELKNLISACNREVKAYLFEGKYAPDPQMELDLK
jgi:hypothetical protein